MNAGTPDYYQTVRNTYGAAKRETGVETVTANDVTEILAVEGKGKIYGGVGYLDHTGTQRESNFILRIDGQLVTEWTFEHLNEFGINKEHANPVYMLKYNDVKFVYCVGISHGQTFEQSVVLEYRENHGDTPDVAGHLVYAVIE